MEWIVEPQAWVTLTTLTLLEIVLGIDNIIFISVMVQRLPPQRRRIVMLCGLGLAMLTRIALLLSLAWLMSMTSPVFSVLQQSISWRDIILIAGGVFLLGKSTVEIHKSLESPGHHAPGKGAVSVAWVLLQIAVIDIVFSLDSVITAVGLAQHVEVMVIAIVLSVVVMVFAAQSISDFIAKHPTFKMLALSFLVLIGTALIAEGFDYHIPRGYLYFAMVFSVVVEGLNIKVRRKLARE